ncbi:hypothetical protein [Azospirillum sp. SYSU D00513]|uniref:hypothetical protein n=1 Tax=Azospirillum sp. SYSU D00513 TaxID=2812561 RepID=UPI001A97CE3D|nr:hypothetical protein [Azospirillum sp. SYSU D00513]
MLRMILAAVTLAHGLLAGPAMAQDGGNAPSGSATDSGMGSWMVGDSGQFWAKPLELPDLGGARADEAAGPSAGLSPDEPCCAAVENASGAGEGGLFPEREEKAGIR